MPTDFQELSFHLTTDGTPQRAVFMHPSSAPVNRKTKNARISRLTQAFRHDFAGWQRAYLRRPSFSISER
jgi:hypothetical protein